MITLERNPIEGFILDPVVPRVREGAQHAGNFHVPAIEVTLRFTQGSQRGLNRRSRPARCEREQQCHQYQSPVLHP